MTTQLLTLMDVDFLAQSASQHALSTLQANDLSPSHTLTLLQKLRQQFDPHQAGILLAQARLRQRATLKFGDAAHQMLFDADALEQASHPLVRHYRAHQLSTHAPITTLVDAGCGIGADALAFAQTIPTVHALDIDPVRIAIARYNARILGADVQFTLHDIRQPLTHDAQAIFFDPARRHHGKRIFNVEDYQPPLSLVRTWHTPHRMVKLAPGVDSTQLADYQGTLEFISVAGDLKEAVLWLNPDATHLDTRATLLQTDGTTHHYAPTPQPPARIHAPLNWLIEPDPAIIRAGFVRQLGAELHAYQLHPDIAYLTSDAPPISPFIRAWRIRSWQPYHIKQLRKTLREHGITHVTVKKRGMPIIPEAFIKELKLKGDGTSATLVLTRYNDQRIIIICDDINKPPSPMTCD